MWVFLVVTILVAVGASFVGGLLLAVLVLLVGFGITGGVWAKRHRTGEAQVREFRGQARKAGQDDSDVQFTDRDRTTLNRP